MRLVETDIHQRCDQTPFRIEGGGSRSDLGQLEH